MINSKIFICCKFQAKWNVNDVCIRNRMLCHHSLQRIRMIFFHSLWFLYWKKSIGSSICFAPNLTKYNFRFKGHTLDTRAFQRTDTHTKIHLRPQQYDEFFFFSVPLFLYRRIFIYADRQRWTWTVNERANQWTKLDLFLLRSEKIIIINSSSSSRTNISRSHLSRSVATTITNGIKITM